MYITYTYTAADGDFIDFDAAILNRELETLLGPQGEPEVWLLETNRSPDELIITVDDSLDTSGLDALIASHGSQAGIDARAADQAAENAETGNLYNQLQSLIDNYTFAQLETTVNNVFSDHTAQQRSFLLQLARILLYLAKGEERVD